MGILKTVFLEPANLFGMADRLWKPTVLPLIKYYATVRIDHKLTELFQFRTTFLLNRSITNNRMM